MSKTASKSVKWHLLKSWTILSFNEWCFKGKHNHKDPKDLLEYLMQQGFLKGKEWRKFIDDVPDHWLMCVDNVCMREPLREGYIPGDTWINK